jgi:hypothetical protein
VEVGQIVSGIPSSDIENDPESDGTSLTENLENPTLSDSTDESPETQLPQEIERGDDRVAQD